jgi:hypothetical protein
MFVRRSLYSTLLLAAGVVVSSGPVASAQVPQATPQPSRPAEAAAAPQNMVAVVSIAPLEKLLQDVNYISAALGQEQAGGMVSMMAAGFTQGIDRSRPIGLLVPLVEGLPAPIMALPTENVREFLRRLEQQLGPADELDDGTLVVAAGPSLVYIRQAGNWAYAAQDQAHLAGLPEDPTTLMQEMHTRYTLGVSLNLQAVPEEQRGIVTEQLRQGFQQALRQQEGEEAGQRQAMAEQSLRQIEELIEDTESLTIGWAVDQPGRRTYLDFAVTATEGSKFARVAAGQEPIPSKFAAVIQPEAAAYFHSAASVPPEAIEDARTGMEQMKIGLRAGMDQAEDLPPQVRADLESYLTRLLDLITETYEEGKVDMGALLRLDGDQLRFVGGAFVADGAKVEQLARDLAQTIQAQTTDVRFRFDADQHQEHSLHYIEADIPERDQGARRVFGPEVKVTLATAPDAFYFALGPQSEEALKRLIDQADADGGDPERALSQMRIALLPILQYAQTVRSNAMLDEVIAQLNAAGVPGELTAVTRGIERGQHFQVSIGEGILRAIGAAIQSQTRQARPQF